MLQRLVVMLLGVTVLGAVMASAASLTVNGGTLQGFTLEAITPIPTPEPPELTCVFDAGTGILYWTEVDGATAYQVYNSPPGADDYDTYGDPIEAPASSTVVGSEEIGHLFALTAIGAGGESMLSNPVYCPTSGTPGAGPTSLDADGEEEGEESKEDGPQTFSLQSADEGTEGNDLTEEPTEEPAE